MEKVGEFPVDSEPVGETPNVETAAELTTEGQGVTQAATQPAEAQVEHDLTVESVDEPRDARGRTQEERERQRARIFSFYHDLSPAERRRRTAELPRVRARLGNMAWRQAAADADAAK